jgi:ribosomal protein S18 acetylase RimI-like enzyme
MLGSKFLRKKSTINLRSLSQRLNATRVATSRFYGYGSGLEIEFEEGPLTKEKIKTEIKKHKNRDFCGDESSITRNDLAGYIGGNTTIYNYKGGLGGILVVGKRKDKVDYLYIYGICVPPKFKGIGKKLMNIAKKIARENSLSTIRLECYGDVHKFYLKQGYSILSEKELVNSNNNSNNSNYEPTIKYVMEYVVGSSPRTPRSDSRTPRAPRTPRNRSRSRTPSFPLVKNLNKS